MFLSILDNLEVNDVIVMLEDNLTLISLYMTINIKSV